MLTELETLHALARCKTMGKAGSSLAISQSAVSKRIANLENITGRKMIERSGNRVILTPAAVRMLEKSTPLLSDLKDVIHENEESGISNISIGIEISVLSSWGAQLISSTINRLPQIDLELHARPSNAVFQRVISGEYMVGIISVKPESSNDIHYEKIVDEPMVIVPSGLKKFNFSPQQKTEVLSIEVQPYHTWSTIKKQVKKIGIEPVQNIESFFCIAQLASIGMGHGLVPMGTAQALNIPQDKLISLKQYNVCRPIYMIARKTTFARPSVTNLKNVIIEESTNLQF